MQRYFGTYHRFDTEGKREAAGLLGADNMVGDIYRVKVEMHEGGHRGWLVNRFDARVGYFDADFSRKLAALEAQGLAAHAILTTVAFTEDGEGGHYWGRAAVICYNDDDAASPAFNAFTEGVAQKIAQDIHPKIDLDESGQRIIDSNGAWLPDDREKFPKPEKGTAVLKSRRGIKDQMIEAGRAGNKGCYVASWVFLLGLITLLMFTLKGCF